MYSKVLVFVILKISIKDLLVVIGMTIFHHYLVIQDLLS
jgi:hypothetical protein